MKLFVLTLYLFLNPMESDTLYQQNIRFLEPGLFKSHAKGTIYITQNQLHFVAHNDKKSAMNFSIPLKSILRIKNEWQYLFPNRLSVKTKSKTYLLYTYKRKALKEAISNQITSLD